MITLNDFITFEHDLEHDSEHDLAHKKEFSPPKIYNANGDLSKRWYVYFSYRDIETGKLKRQKNIYGSANSFKTKEDRLALLSRYRRRLLKLLQHGYNPNSDNTKLYNAKLLKANTAEHKEETVKKTFDPQVAYPKIKTDDVSTKTSILENNETEDHAMSLRDAFDFSLRIKEKQISSNSLKDYTYTTNAVVKWTKENHPRLKNIDQFNKKAALKFLNSVLLRSSSRNRNNYRLNLSSLLQTLEDNEIISTNPIKNIPVLRSIPKRNKSYSTEEHEKIFTYLKKEDPLLLLYIKFISYNLLRPVEVCRLKIKDINLVDKTIQFKAKNSPLKTKLIPKKILDELPELSKLDPDFHLFTPVKIGGDWDTADVNKSNYFSKRFKTVVKDHFHLDKEQTLYSFRHTFITILYQSLVKGSSPHAAKSELMNITGHSTMDALEKYLRNVDAILPNDYSNHFDND
ncbi:tyrosine-type recombinase/integrase [Psychroserpens burtonensis]|uniref:Tyrosine-type recombinase/integrase n=1 Tax=Psychroserpens burtonensis TaxID=49278 RepID=A0A5C7B835_9FLAO|nr:tyrosine-type recombinase/integrase [Psychroserpens burtonensis]TXE16020.1 tyrosine-type recombinase/integrase [Psychroserpens burtonensis]